MRPILYSPDAQLELEEAVLWYERWRPGLGVELVNFVRMAERRLQVIPVAVAPLGNDVISSFLLPFFPCTLYFLNLEDAIWIAAVAHRERKPGYWVRRSS